MRPGVYQGEGRHTPTPSGLASSLSLIWQTWPAGQVAPLQLVSTHWPAAQRWPEGQLTPTQRSSVQVPLTQTETAPHEVVPHELE